MVLKDREADSCSPAGGCAIGLAGQPTGVYNVQIAANSAGVGVHSNVHAGSCICTEATETIVPRYVHDAMRVLQQQKPLHADLHVEVQSESVGKKIDTFGCLRPVTSSNVAGLFTSAFGGKVDMGWCGSNVRF